LRGGAAPGVLGQVDVGEPDLPEVPSALLLLWTKEEGVIGIDIYELK